MKTILGTFAIVTALVLFYVRTGVRPQQVHDVLPSGQVNSELEQIGLEKELRKEVKIYFRTNFTSCGILRDYDSRHRFADGTIASAVLIRWNDGKEEWLKRDGMDHCWIQRHQ